MNEKHSTQQILLPFGFGEEKTFSSYYVGENEAILKILHNTAIGRGEYFLYLWGKEKVGLSHLLQACCQTANKKGLRAFYLTLRNLQSMDPSIFDDLEKMHLVCVDDLQEIAGDSAWEEAFFDFFHRMQEGKHRLIVAAKRSPERLGLKLADIVSRLKSGIIFLVQDLSDEEKVQALLSRAQHRGIELSPEVADFILHHFPRDLGALFYFLDRLDQASLEHHRKITIPFVKQVLA